MATIKHIVFDIGNVLIGWDRERGFVEQIPDANERRWFLDNICTMDWNLEQDRGRSWEDAEELLIRQFPDHQDNIRTFRRNWAQMVIGEISGSVEILNALIANGHDVTMLTNFAGDTFEIAQERFDFLGFSRGVTVSAHISMIKPDVEIYQHHAQTFGLIPEHSLFIDDSLNNVKGAIAAGWNSVQFKNPETLKADLGRFGINL